MATDTDEYVADVVVNAAGYRAGEVMALLGQTLPTVTMSHQYLVTEDIPEFRERRSAFPCCATPTSPTTCARSVAA